MPNILATDITLVPVSDLHLHPRNPRRGNVDQIAESIRVNGFTAPLIVQRYTMRILAGNHRWRAACKLGMTEVPCVLVDVDDSRALRILLSDNRASDLGTNDQTQLVTILQEIAAEPDALAGTCYSADALAAMLVKATPPAQFKEFNESAADKVKMATCPECGATFPR